MASYSLDHLPRYADNGETITLSAAGAQDIAVPRCGECGLACGYVSSKGGHWGCSRCFDKPAVCAGCHEERRIVSRDRHGEPRCTNYPDTEGDPLEELTEVVTGLDPVLNADVVLAALGRATVRPAGRRRLAWAVVARPELLTGAGFEAPTPAVLRSIDELVQVGAAGIVRPACPRCHEVTALSKLLDGKRVCQACFAHQAAVPCFGCGAVREPATRDAEGRPLCPNCMIRKPENLEECVGWGRRKPVANRLSNARHPPTTSAGCSQEDAPGTRSATTRTACASTRSVSGPGRTAPPRWSLSPPKCLPRSSPRCSGATSKWPSSGKRHQASGGDWAAYAADVSRHVPENR